MKWVSAKGSDIPKSAFKGGEEADGRPLFVTRAFNNGYWHTGKAGYQFNGCHTESHWKEVVYTEYEVLTIPPDAHVVLKWGKYFCGHVHDDSVRIDPAYDIYVGRHEHGGGVYPGKIDLWN